MDSRRWGGTIDRAADGTAGAIGGTGERWDGGGDDDDDEEEEDAKTSAASAEVHRGLAPFALGEDESCRHRRSRSRRPGIGDAVFAAVVVAAIVVVVVR
jgi:hypothetical protein